jgi:hypothetical protein
MKLINFKDNELIISDEAFHIKCFKELYDRDSEEAFSIFGYLYFMYYPGSDYNYITDYQEKEETVLEALGLDKPQWLLDPLFIDCLSVYKKMVQTTSSLLLDNNRKRLSKIDVFLDNLELDEDNINKYTKAIADVNKLGVEIAQAEKEIHKDIEEQTTKAKGRAELTIGDRGLNNL